MPRSCKCILDTMVHKGAMTEKERDKIVRNLKTQNEGRKTMGKLIDVDAFKARLSAGLVYQGADVLEALDEQPTIEERKTGKWIEKDGWDGDVYYDCSACGESWTTIEGTPWDNDMNYCPHCGAKMGADKEGAEG